MAGPAVALLVALTLPGIFTRDLWLDEGYSMAAARAPWTSIRGEHGTMATYYALAGPWSTISSSGWWLRVLSLVLMAAGLVVFAALVRRQWGASVARWAALFGSASYVIVDLAGEARSYGLVVLLVVSGWYALDRLLAEPVDRRWWWVYWACCALLPLTHGVALLQIGAQALAVLAVRAGREHVRRVFAGLGIALTAMVGLAVAGIGSEGNWVAPMRWADALVFFEAISSPNPVLAAALAVAAVAALVRLRGDLGAPTDPLARFRVVMWGIWAIVPVGAVLAVSFVRPLYIPRYSAASVLGLAGLLAVGLRSRSGSARVPIGLAMVLSLLIPGGVLGGKAGGPTWSVAARRVRAEVRLGDVFVFPDADLRLPFEVAWSDRRTVDDRFEVMGVVEPLGSLRRYDEGLDYSGLAHALARSGADRVFVISNVLPGQDGSSIAFAKEPEVRACYRLSKRWPQADGIEVDLLVRQ